MSSVKVARTNRVRTLTQLVTRGLATKREVTTDRGRLILFKPVDVGLSHPNSLGGVSVETDTSEKPDTTLSTTGVSGSVFSASKDTPDTPPQVLG